MNKTNILHLTIDTRYGGVYRFIENWAEIDSYKNKKISHNTFQYQSLLHSKILKNKYFPSNIREKSGYFFLLDFILNLPLYIIFSFKSDFIVLHSNYLLPITIFLKIFNKKFILISHDFNNPLLIRIFINLFFSNKIICVAPWLKEYFKINLKSNLINKLLNKFHKIKIVLPIEKNKLNFSKENNFLYKPIMDNKISLVYIGSLSFVKGISDLIELIKKENLNLDLHIIGKKNKRYLDYSRFSSEVNNLTFYGEILDNSTKSEIVNKVNFAIIPSRSEVFPFVYSEYLTYGIIPLCSRLEVFSKVANSNDHLFDIKDVNSFYRVINWAIGLDQNMYNSYLSKLQNDFCIFLKDFHTIEDLSKIVL